MSVVQLPAENLEHIFYYLDGKSFCKVKEVCKTWYEIIKEMQLKRKIWKEFCIQEISDYIIEELLSYKTVPDRDNCLNWITVYKKWYKSRLVIKAPHSLKRILEPGRNFTPITCLKLSDNWILTGHSSGHFSIWNQHSGELLQRCMIHLKTIVDIALIDLLNLGSYYGTEDLPWGHHHAITISKDSYIQVISLLETVTLDKIKHLSYHSSDLTAIRVFDSCFAVSASDNTISVWGMKLMKKPYFHLNIMILHRVIGPSDNLLSFGFWRNNIQCISCCGKLRVFDLGYCKWSEITCLKQTYSSDSNKIVTVTKTFLFRGNIVIMFTSDGRMVVSIDDRFNNQYYLMKHLQTLIISVALKGALFVLGGENGKIYVFHVPETESLLQLNLAKPSFTIRLSEASITSLDIVYALESPIIMASTNESIFVLKWFTTVSSHQEIKQGTLAKSRINDPLSNHKSLCYSVESCKGFFT